MFGLINPYFYAGLAVALLASFASGYEYKAHLVAVEQAAVQAKQDTVQTVVESTTKATDQLAVTKLQAELAANKQHAASLQQIIKETAHVRQNDPTVIDCNLPFGLRDALNADLAASQ